MPKAKKIKVDNYGEMLALLNGMELLDYFEKGSYQGEYLAIARDEDRIFFYQGGFGSCSGCDWLEDYNDWESKSKKRYAVPYKEALKYCGDIKPKWIIPKDDKDLLKTVLRLNKRFLKEDYA